MSGTAPFPRIQTARLIRYKHTITRPKKIIKKGRHIDGEATAALTPSSTRRRCSKEATAPDVSTAEAAAATSEVLALLFLSLLFFF